MTHHKHDERTKSDRNRRGKAPKPGDKDYIGHPFETDREAVEEGQEREGTNLDLGEERSEEQKEEAERAKPD